MDMLMEQERLLHFISPWASLQMELISMSLMKLII